MSAELQTLNLLLDEFIKRINLLRGNDKELGRMSLSLQRALGMSDTDVIGLLQKSYGYVEKSSGAATSPRPMKKLPLRSALRNVGVEVIDEARGRYLHCLRCDATWQPGFVAGQPDSLPKGGHLCPAGCNASASFDWDGGNPEPYNPMFP